MCLGKVRYYKVGKGMIYVYDMDYKQVKVYGFKPFNKRVKFRDVRIFHSSHRFFLLRVGDFKYLDKGGRELKLGVSYL